jgi:hypothetical protein
MTNPSNATSISTLATAHTAAETGGVTFGTGAVQAPLGNATTWSRSSARVAFGSGLISQGAFNAIMNALSNYERTQYQAAREPKARPACCRPSLI